MRYFQLAPEFRHRGYGRVAGQRTYGEAGVAPAPAVVAVADTDYNTIYALLETPANAEGDPLFVEVPAGTSRRPDNWGTREGRLLRRGTLNG